MAFLQDYKSCVTTAIWQRASITNVHMRPISKKFRKIINKDPFFKVCIRKSEGSCNGRITIEHAWMYAGRQIDAMWNFVPLCEYHHFDDLDKNYGRFISLGRATSKELNDYPRVNWTQEYSRLKHQYGKSEGKRF
jgi:hypothetical protein